MVMKRTCSFGSSRNAPRNWAVTVAAPGFSTPRNDMHMCSASIIQMANGAYLDTKNNILTMSDGTQIDTVTGIKISDLEALENG